MELKEFKEKTQSKVVDIIAHLGVFTLNEIMDIEDVREAKKNFDELSDLINEYIKEYDKQKFKVGDYVVERNRFVFEISAIDRFGIPVGHCCDTEDDTFSLNTLPIDSKYIRHATQEEIAEYNAALQFHEHGRKPFEVKAYDIVRDIYSGVSFVGNPEAFYKGEFVSGKYNFLKTAEEVEAWLNDGKTDVG